MNKLEEVYSEWQNNPEFRDSFNKNPKETLEKWGFYLNDNDLALILKFKKDNEELDKRISK